ncbi:MAG: MFS transporter [Rhodospirillaceae bacterium]|nr:MFS transporter [Rhodospirillaceae bacterium]
MSKDKQKAALRTCCGAHILHDGLTDILYGLLPLLREAFGLTYAEVGMIRSAHRVATAALQIPVGMWSEKAGTRSLLVAGTIIAGAGFIGLGFANGFWMVLAFIFLAGCGGAFQHPLSSAIISNAYPGEGQRAALGTYNAFGDIGKFLFLGSLILCTAGLGFSWQVPVFGAGILSFVTAIGVLFALKAASIGGAPVVPDKETVVQTVNGWGVKHRRGFFLLGTVTALDNSTRNGFLTFAAFLMIEKGVATEWAALAVLFTVFGGMCGKMAVGLIAERIGVTKTIALTEFATSALILLVVVTPSLYAFFLLPVLGVFLNGTSSAIYGTVPDLIEGQKHSRAYGLIYTLGSVCGIVAPLVYGLLSDWTSITTAMVVIAGVVLLTVPLCGPLAVALREARAT